MDNVIDRRLNNTLLFIFLFTTLSGAVRKWLIHSDTVGNAILLIQILIPFIFLLISNRSRVFSGNVKNILFIYFMAVFAYYGCQSA